MLPSEKTPIKKDLSDQTILIYGSEKIGKSTFCSHMDNAIFLATEAGLNHLDVYQIPVDSWESFVTACGELKSGEHNFKTVVIDVVDKLYNMCHEYICEKHGIIHASDFAYGKGWALVNNEFTRVLTKLSLLPYGLVIVSHAKDQELDERTGKYVKSLPNLSGGAMKIVVGMSDFILYFTGEVDTDDNNATERRVIHTKPSKFYDAGDRTGALPATLDLDYGQFIAAYRDAVNTTTSQKQERTKTKDSKVSPVDKLIAQFNQIHTIEKINDARIYVTDHEELSEQEKSSVLRALNAREEIIITDMEKK